MFRSKGMFRLLFCITLIGKVIKVQSDTLISVNNKPSCARLILHYSLILHKHEGDLPRLQIHE